MSGALKLVDFEALKSLPNLETIVVSRRVHDGHGRSSRFRRISAQASGLHRLEDLERHAGRVRRCRKMNQVNLKASFDDIDTLKS
jgi:hypothetical protein